MDKCRNIKIECKKWVELDIFNIDCTAFLENQFVNKKTFLISFYVKALVIYYKIGRNIRY